MVASSVHSLNPPDVLILSGPTASGKSALALEIARYIPSVIINADALQAYGALSILTARPSSSALSQVPHVLYGHLHREQTWSVGRFLDDLERVLPMIQKEGKTAIVVGGTGLYLTSLEKGLSLVPEIPKEIQNHWRLLAEREGSSALYAHLMARCPEEALRLSPKDTSRLTRALEFFETVGTGLKAYLETAPKKEVLKGYSTLKIKSLPPKEHLEDRARERLKRMVLDGVLDEVRALGVEDLPPSSPLRKVIGLAPFHAHLLGACTLNEALEKAFLQTRQYIKRQKTWIQKHMTEYDEVETAQEVLNCMAKHLY